MNHNQIVVFFIILLILANIRQMFLFPKLLAGDEPDNPIVLLSMLTAIVMIVGITASIMAFINLL